MADNIKVSPTPIQRNSADVAMELIHLHVRLKATDVNDFGELYSKYFAMAETLKRKSPNELAKLLPDDFYATKSRV
jgi:hypothetical protein